MEDNAKLGRSKRGSYLINGFCIFLKLQIHEFFTYYKIEPHSLVFFFFFFFFMNGNTERAQCALSQVCIPRKKEKKCNKTIV